MLPVLSLCGDRPCTSSRMSGAPPVGPRKQAGAFMTVPTRVAGAAGLEPVDRARLSMTACGRGADALREPGILLSGPMRKAMSVLEPVYMSVMPQRLPFRRIVRAGLSA